jgi:ornithine cyclodeaminase
MPVPEKILYLTEDDIQKTISPGEAVDLAEKGIIADAAGKVNGDKYYMNVGKDGFVKPFSGYIEGEDFAFVKTFSYFPINPEKYDRPTTSSMVILLDAETGLPACFMEAGWITGMKTAASTAVTTAYLASPDSKVVTIFGAGTLGRMHLIALAERFELERAYFIDLRLEAAQTCAAELGPMLGFDVQAVSLEERESSVRESDIVFTVTTGSQELVKQDWVKPGVFIARLGSYQEVSHDVILQADKVIVDCWKYVSPRIPEIIDLKEEGGRESKEEVIVYIALGIWGEYAAILPEVYRKARQMGIGQDLPCSH